MIREFGLRLLAHLHARGFHAAVIAAVVMMPTVAAVGFFTRGADPEVDGQPMSARVAHLRPTLTENSAAAGR